MNNRKTIKVVVKNGLKNVKGDVFEKGEIVTVDKCWLNSMENEIYIHIQEGVREVITSVDEIEYLK